MTWIVLGQASPPDAGSPYTKLIVAAVLAAIGLWLMIPGTSRIRRVLGAVVALAGLGTLGVFLSETPITNSVDLFQAMFWLLTAATIVPATGAITAHNPVYAAILFALSLVGTAGLFLLQGAQFLGVATIVVYAGAIVVTFLFVVMLAQPDGHAIYDRISWGGASKPLAVVASMGLLTVLAVALHDYLQGDGQSSAVRMRSRIETALAEIDRGGASEPDQATPTTKLRRLRRRNRLWIVDLQNTNSETSALLQTQLAHRLDLPPAQLKVQIVSPEGGIDHPQHVANLGAQLFARHLVSIEVAGTLLLMALVGAVAIVMQQSPTTATEQGAGNE